MRELKDIVLYHGCANISVTDQISLRNPVLFTIGPVILKHGIVLLAQ